MMIFLKMTKRKQTKEYNMRPSQKRLPGKFCNYIYVSDAYSDTNPLLIASNPLDEGGEIGSLGRLLGGHLMYYPTELIYMLYDFFFSNRIYQQRP
jgi:hypothetical protein